MQLRSQPVRSQPLGRPGTSRVRQSPRRSGEGDGAGGAGVASTTRRRVLDLLDKGDKSQMQAAVLELVSTNATETSRIASESLGPLSLGTWEVRTSAFNWSTLLEAWPLSGWV